MARPTFLVVEPEPGNALSTRKLVLETAKYNVITAHTWGEAAELYQRFSKVDAIIVTDEVDNGVPCLDFVARVKRSDPSKTVILLAANEGRNYGCGDQTLSSHDPHSLVELLRCSFGDPRP
jgi:CheY-like chemotaxis protein